VNEIIKKTIDATDENTFLYLLHEDGIFDEALLQEYMENVSLVTTENTEKETIKKIIERNEYILCNALYHFLPDDLHVIKNFPSNMNDYVGMITDENMRLIRML
jgi:hypothetical protein